MKLRMVGAIVLAGLALAGCRRGTVEIQRNGSGTATVTVTEADVNAEWPML